MSDHQVMLACFLGRLCCYKYMAFFQDATPKSHMVFSQKNKQKKKVNPMSQHVPTIPSWSPEMVGAIVAVAAKHQGNQRSLVHHQLALLGFVPAFWP